MRTTQSKSMVGRRMVAFMVDIAMMFAVGFLFFGLVGTRIVEATTDLTSIRNTLNEDSDRYRAIEEEYGLYYIDGSGNRVPNNSATTADLDAFYADPRVAPLSNDIQEGTHYLFGCFVYQFSISAVFGGALFYIVLPLCLGKGRTLGKFFFKLVVVDGGNQYVRWPIVLLRGFLEIVFNIFFMVASFGFVGLANLVVCINSKDNKALYELMTKTKTVEGIIPVGLNPNLDGSNK